MFENMGVDKVRLLISTSGLPPETMLDAVNWLAQRDKEERLSNSALMASQARVALSAKNAAWIAAIIAMISAIVAIVLGLR
jgi:hypothetical protein